MKSSNKKKIKYMISRLKPVRLYVICSCIIILSITYLFLFLPPKSKITSFNEHLTSVNYSVIIENGIDVSIWQGDINWKKVKKAGIDFAIIRTGYGFIDRESQTDQYFHKNIKNAKKANIKIGAYHYSHALNVEEAIEEAEFVLSLIEGYKFDYPIYYDLEDASQLNLSQEELTDIAIAFLSVIEEAGYQGGIYANCYWLTSVLDMDRLKDYEIWIAFYTDYNDYLGSYGVWQFSETGIIDGIEGYVDLNVAYKKY
jgi:Lyzozyme M1 (1,4-beta-N-acetylmuramidase)